MKPRSGVVFLLLGVLVAAGAAVLAVQIVRGLSETTPVVVAVRDLAPYQPVTADDIRVADVPAVSVPGDAARQPEQVVGRYTRDALYAGDMVRERRLADVRGDRGLLAAQVTELKDPAVRAFALPHDAVSAVGGEIAPGDRVDIIASVKIDAGNSLQVGVGKIVAANVLVLKVTGGGSQEEGSGKGTVIVALKPDQIEDIAFALTSGQVRFALNPYTTDVAAAQTQGVTGRAWLEKYGFLSGQPSSPGAPDPAPRQ